MLIRRWNVESKTFASYVPQKRNYPLLRAELREQLQKIEPSNDGMMSYFPCMVALSTGEQIDCVYFAEADSYIKVWGIWPDDDKGKQFIKIENVASVHSSPSRLPVHLAQKMYKAGESGMGYCIFTLRFNDSSTQVYLSGNAVDFVSLPVGKTMADVVDLLPNKGHNQKYMQAPKYHWCLFGGKK